MPIRASRGSELVQDDITIRYLIRWLTADVFPMSNLPRRFGSWRGWLYMCFNTAFALLTLPRNDDLSASIWLAAMATDQMAILCCSPQNYVLGRSRDARGRTSKRGSGRMGAPVGRHRMIAPNHFCFCRTEKKGHACTLEFFYWGTQCPWNDCTETAFKTTLHGETVVLKCMCFATTSGLGVTQWRRVVPHCIWLMLRNTWLRPRCHSQGQGTDGLRWPPIL